MSNRRLVKSRGQVPREVLLIEERFLLQTQAAMQRLLNNKGLKYRNLAHLLGVSEARVSQMFGDDAQNLTIRSVARIFQALGEIPVLTTEREFAQRSDGAVATVQWNLAGVVDESVDTPPTIVVVTEDALPRGRERSRSSATITEWGRAESASEHRQAA